LQSILKVGDAEMKVRCIEQEEELSIISVEVMVPREEMRVLSGMVYNLTKRKGPRTEPWGTPQKQT